MAFATSYTKLTKENILKELDSYQLFKAYCRNFDVLGRMFKSEFRKDDTPSCHIIMWEGDLLYKDFGEKGYRIFDYIARKYETDFIGVMRIINRDFNLGLGSSSSVKVEVSKVIPEKPDFDMKDFEHHPTTIEVKRRRWTKADRDYWSQYEIPPLLLKYHNIFSIESYKVNSKHQDNVSYRMSLDRLAYTMDYYWYEGIFRRKIYLPQTKGRYRFISNVNNTIVQGWSLLPKSGSNILFVTKSYLDSDTFPASAFEATDLL